MKRGGRVVEDEEEEEEEREGEEKERRIWLGAVGLA